MRHRPPKGHSVGSSGSGQTGLSRDRGTTHAAGRTDDPLKSSMSEDAFRWIVVIGVLLAAMAFILQAAFVYGMYRVAKASEEKLTPLLEDAAHFLGPV